MEAKIIQDFCVANLVSISYAYNYEKKQHTVVFFRIFDGNLAAPKGAGPSLEDAFRAAVKNYREMHTKMGHP